MWITESKRKYEAIQHNKAVDSFREFSHFNKVVNEAVATVTEAMNTEPTAVLQNSRVVKKIIASIRVSNDLKATSRALNKESVRFTNSKLRTTLRAVSVALAA